MLSKGGPRPKQQLSFHASSSGKPNTITTIKPKVHGEGEGCSHCGNAKHTKEKCFKLHGYPDLWQKLNIKKKCEPSGGDNPGRAAFMSVESQLSLVSQPKGFEIKKNDSGNQCYVFFCSNIGNCNG